MVAGQEVPEVQDHVEEVDVADRVKPMPVCGGWYMPCVVTWPFTNVLHFRQLW